MEISSKRIKEYPGRRYSRGIRFHWTTIRRSVIPGGWAAFVEDLHPSWVLYRWTIAQSLKENLSAKILSPHQSVSSFSQARSYPFTQSKNIAVTHDIPGRSDLISGSRSTDVTGSNIRNGREVLFLYKNEDRSELKALISKGISGNWIFPDIAWRSPATHQG